MNPSQPSNPNPPAAITTNKPNFWIGIAIDIPVLVGPVPKDNGIGTIILGSYFHKVLWDAGMLAERPGGVGPLNASRYLFNVSDWRISLRLVREALRSVGLERFSFGGYRCEAEDIWRQVWPVEDPACPLASRLSVESINSGGAELKLMPAPSHNVWTAAELARAQGCTKRAILKRLATVPAGAVKFCSGNQAKAWRVIDLPSGLRSELETLAENRQCLTVDDLLANTSAQWQPRIPLAETRQDYIDKAFKLRSALAPIMEMKSTMDTAAKDLQEIGLDAYRREFGHTVTSRHLSNLINRTARRAGNAPDWNRLELYIDDDAARKAPCSPHAAELQEDFQELREWVSQFKDPMAPTLGEKNSLWLKSFRWLESRIESGVSPTRAKRRLLPFLSNLVWLAANANALRVSFDRKYKRYVSEGQASALDDRRLAKLEKPKAPAWPEADLRIIESRGVFRTGGRLAQAVHESVEDEQSGLTLETRNRLATCKGSYVPQSLRGELGRTMRLVMELMFGKKRTDDASAWLDLDWNGVPSYWCFTADDFTFPVYFVAPDGTLTRGQVLLMTEARTNYILGYVLIPEDKYNSLHIRSLITQVCSKHGLPRLFWFECGIWKKSALLHGDKNAPDEALSASEAVSWPDCVFGLQRLGVEFQHARKARSKPGVERIGGRLQDCMHGEKGYCGREERHDCPEETHRNKMAVEAGRAHALEHFYSFEQWNARLREIIERYNSRIQHGKKLNGLSPFDGLAKFDDKNDPSITFDARCLHLLACQSGLREVTVNGIQIKMRGKTYWFRDDNSGALVGKRVRVDWDIDNPQFIVATELGRNNPVRIERANPVDPRDKEAIATEQARANAHNAHIRERYHVLKGIDRATRPISVDRQNAAIGQKIDEGRERVATRQRETDSRNTRIRSRANKLGLPMEAINTADDETADYLQMRLDAKKRYEEKKLGGQV